MVVYEWFARISQVIAPDKKYNAEVFDEPAKQDSVSLWHILAPDPNFTAASTDTTGTSTGNRTDDDNTKAAATPKASAVGGFMQTPDAHTGDPTRTAVATYTPSPYRRQWKGTNTDNDVMASLQSPRSMVPFSSREVEQQVLSAAKDRASFMTSPVASLRSSSAAYRICKNPTTLKPAILNKLKEMIMSDPSILQMRSYGTSYECPDGYTLFMAATHANQIGAMKVIWDCCTELDAPSNQGGGKNENHPNNHDDHNSNKNAAVHDLLSLRNLEGKTVFHIAAERGHLEAIEFLEEQSVLVLGGGSHNDTDTVHHNNSSSSSTATTNKPPPVDLLGHTPLGLALLSPEVQAKKNKKEVLAKLYNEQDQSIMGSPFPVEQRIVGDISTIPNQKSSRTEHSLRAIAGMSEIPGKRIRMEDCTVCHANDSALLLAVCDGHGDEGHISQFVAESLVTGIEEHLPTLLLTEGVKNESTATTTTLSPENSSWEYVCTDLCLHIDDALYTTTSLRGGSVGVLMVVTHDNLIVANVGDCRCILVQSKQPSASATDENDLVEQTQQLSIMDRTSATELEWFKKYHVQALSTDHKPNIESEHERITGSGLKVVAEKVDASLTIHKIQLSDGNKLATSRAFGDFEYKANEKREIHEQAVIAIPEVVVQPRCNDDVVMIAACDGIWDVMTNEEVAMFVTQRLDHYCDSAKTGTVDASILPKIGDELVLECLRRNSEDNMSVVIVALSNAADRVTLGSSGEGNGSGSFPVVIVPPKQLKYESTTN